MSILSKAMKIEIRCLNRKCQKTLVFDSNEYPPRRYCSRECSDAERAKRYRDRQKVKGVDQPPTP